MSPNEAAITLCIAAAAGIFLIALADRLRLPSIALLLLGGILLGPDVLGWVHPESLGRGLETVVTLAVAVVLFEGGLTLDVAGFRREPKVIVRILTLGVLVTWAGTAVAVYAVYPHIQPELAVIAGSLVIVTGPTVVSPLLRRIGLRPRLYHILYWEGVLVNALGVFVAVLCFEWIAASADQPLLAPLGRFASRFVIGAGIGLAVGLGLGLVLRRRWVSQQHTNIVVLASALLALGLANAVLEEAGILAVIVAGLVVSLQRAPQLKQLKRFKLELTEVGIGLLFVLLAAKLDLHSFARDGGRLLWILALLLFVLRPLNILLSTWGLGFSWRERLFLSWLAPRGIVAASMASLFALRLHNLGYAHAELLETLTYAVIGTTVIAQGLSAPALAHALGLKRRTHATWLLIGDPTLAVALHRQLRQAGARSLVMAAGADRAAALAGDGIESVAANPLEPASIRDPRIADVEAVLALARDPELNARICEAWGEVIGPSACYRWDGSDNADNAGDEVQGLAVWTELPSPATLRAAIESGAYALEAVEVGTADDTRRFGAAMRPLLAVDEGRITLVNQADLHPEADSVVVVRKRIPGLYGLLRDAVIVDQPNASFEDIVTTLLDLAERTTPGLPTAAHLTDILDRERTMPTTIGAGVAIPHVYDERCARSAVYAASVTGGLDLSGPDDIPVQLVFLVVSPAGKASEHLAALAALAQLASDPELIDVLARQRTRGRLLTLLRERE